MCYNIVYCHAVFTLRAQHKSAALAAVKALALTPGQMSGRTRNANGTTTHYAYVNTDDFVLAKSLEVALDAWNWGGETAATTGDIVGLTCESSCLGDEAVLFTALAPFVDSGSYIQLTGEDGVVWRWVFQQGQLRKVLPTWDMA